MQNKNGYRYGIDTRNLCQRASYAGMIPIRYKGQVLTALSQPIYRLPCILIIKLCVYLTLFQYQMQDLFFFMSYKRLDQKKN